MYSSNINKIGIQCICWFCSQGICYDARSYDLKMKVRLHEINQRYHSAIQVIPRRCAMKRFMAVFT